MHKKSLPALVALFLSALSWATLADNGMPGGGRIAWGGGGISVSGGSFDGNNITGLQGGATINLNAAPDTGITFGGPGAPADLANPPGFNIAQGKTLTVTGTLGATQTLGIIDLSGSITRIDGTFQAMGLNGAAAPSVLVANSNGFIIGPTGVIRLPSTGGLFTNQDPNAIAYTNPSGSIINNGTIIGATDLSSITLLSTQDYHGSGVIQTNLLVIDATGNVNNPVYGNNFLRNGVRLTSADPLQPIIVFLNLHGSTKQVVNLDVQGDLLLASPDINLLSEFGIPGQNLPVMPYSAGLQPPYGGGSMLVQASGNLGIVNAVSGTFVFPGAIVLKAGGTLDLNGLTIVNGWTSLGAEFQGVFFEAPNIVSSGGMPSVYTNGNNWVNFSTWPQTPAAVYTLEAGAGVAGYVNAGAYAPHLNTYSTLTNAAVNGQCWVCLVNTAPINVAP